MGWITWHAEASALGQWGWEGLWFYKNIAGVLVLKGCTCSVLEEWWTWARRLAEGSPFEAWWCLESDGGSSGVPVPVSSEQRLSQQLRVQGTDSRLRREMAECCQSWLWSRKRDGHECPKSSSEGTSPGVCDLHVHSRWELTCAHCYS